MKKLSALLLSIAIAVSSFAQTESPELRKQVEAVYEQWTAAMMAKDLKAMGAMLAPEFVEIWEDGKRQNRTQMIAQLTQMCKIVRNNRSKIKLLQVQGSEKEAFAWVELTIDAEMKSGNGWKRTTGKVRVVETLKKTANGWVFTMTQPGY